MDDDTRGRAMGADVEPLGSIPSLAVNPHDAVSASPRHLVHHEDSRHEGKILPSALVVGLVRRQLDRELHHRRGGASDGHDRLR